MLLGDDFQNVGLDKFLLKNGDGNEWKKFQVVEERRKIVETEMDLE